MDHRIGVCCSPRSEQMPPADVRRRLDMHVRCECTGLSSDDHQMLGLVASFVAVHEYRDEASAVLGLRQHATAASVRKMSDC
jgi:hypothetical protein